MNSAYSDFDFQNPCFSKYNNIKTDTDTLIKSSVLNSLRNNNISISILRLKKQNIFSDQDLNTKYSVLNEIKTEKFFDTEISEKPSVNTKKQISDEKPSLIERSKKINH